MARKPTPAQEQASLRLTTSDHTTLVVSAESHMDGNVLMLCVHTRPNLGEANMGPAFTKMYRIHPDGTKQAV
jgi:hypothetical protein